MADNVPKLATFSIVLGALYAGMFAFEVCSSVLASRFFLTFVQAFGVLAAVTASHSTLISRIT